MYLTGNKGTVKMGSSNFSRAIEKCQKTIKTHSITKRPEWKKNRPKKPKDKKPAVFDATHSVQLPGAGGACSGGDRRFVPLLARAAAATSVFFKA